MAFIWFTRDSSRKDSPSMLLQIDITLLPHSIFEVNIIFDVVTIKRE